MKDIRRPAHHRSRGPGRLAGLLMALLVVLGLSGSTAIAAPGGTAQQAGSTVRVPDRAMDAVAACSS
jgi:endoglucanase